MPNSEPADAVEHGLGPQAYRLPDASHVGGVRLRVSDLPRSIAFYERVLGLLVLDERTDAAALGPNGGPALLVLETAAGTRRARRGAFGLFHFAMRLPDRATLGKFAAHLRDGGPAETGLRVQVGSADHLVSEAFYLSDPDGLGIEVYADRPRSRWRYDGRQLAMTTEPLDIGAVIAAADGHPWEGAPPGTSIGHVHLHVGDLDQAAAFYHQALGFDETVWSYPGALFMSAGGYHHHLGVNTWAPGPSASPDCARLLDWELVVPSPADVAHVGASLGAAGYGVDVSGNALRTADPWGIRVCVRAER